MRSEFAASVPGCPIMFFATAREAQKCVKTIIENGQAVRANADASDGDHWHYEIDDSNRIVRERRPGNVQ